MGAKGSERMESIPITDKRPFLQQMFSPDYQSRSVDVYTTNKSVHRENGLQFEV
jgi:hypothetical protein